MIYIEQGQVIPENEKLMVSSPSGNYGDSALIEFYNVDNRDIIVGTYQAQFIRYGSMVYKFNDVKELGEEILKIDPESTHTAASYIRMVNELNGKMDEGSLESESLDQIISNEKEKMEEKREDFNKETVTENEVAQEDVTEDEIIEDEVIEAEMAQDGIVEEEVLEEPEEITPELPVETEILTFNKSKNLSKNKIKKIII